MLKLLVFDLDGTLADTRSDLSASVNAALTRTGRRTLPLDTVVSFVGDGARNLLSRSLAAAGTPAGRGPEPVGGTSVDDRDGDLDAALAAFLDHYSRHCMEKTRSYPGLEAALEKLSGYRLAVLTNKPAAPARLILEGLGIARHFAQVVGGDNPLGQKPDPAALLSLLDREGVRPEEALVIGDGTQDLRAARRVGARFLGFLSGMGSREALLAESPEAVFASMADLPEAVAAIAAIATDPGKSAESSTASEAVAPGLPAAGGRK